MPDTTTARADWFIQLIATSTAPKPMAHIPAAWRYANYRTEARRLLDRGDLPGFSRLMDMARMTRTRCSAWERKCMGACIRALLADASINDAETLCKAAGIWWHEASQPNPTPPGWQQVEA